LFAALVRPDALDPRPEQQADADQVEGLTGQLA